MTGHDKYPFGGRKNKLYRDTHGGIIFGVCAGVAEYFGVSLTAVRITTAIALLIFTPATVIAYLAAAAFVPRKPDELYRSEAEAQFWKSVRVEPSRTAGDLRHKMREQERRLRALEAYLTSKEFRLNRDINNLEA